MYRTDDDLIGRLSDFAAEIQRRVEVPALLGDLASRLVATLDVGGASASLVAYGQVYLGTTFPESMSAIHEIEHREQAGPGRDASRAGEPVVVSRLADHAARWPAFAEQAAALGIGAVAAIPMGIEDVVGAATLYSPADRDWLPDELRWARLLALMTAGPVVRATELQRQRHVSEQREQTMATRVIVEQAKGIIAASRKIDIEQAFRILRKYANDHNATLVEVADAVVNIGLRV